MPQPHVTFVPGAAGRAAFWQPIADHLPTSWPCTFIDLPGLGATPADPAVRSYDDLVEHVAARIEEPTVLVGQSMGGYLAMAVALAYPARVSHLVLTVTAGGLDMAALGAADWRPGYGDEYPQAAPWATARVPDLSHRLPGLGTPTLLVWATLVTFDTDDHWVARVVAAETATAIHRFVTSGDAQ